jgi:hypothetical protein
MSAALPEPEPADVAFKGLFFYLNSSNIKRTYD